MYRIHAERNIEIAHRLDSHRGKCNNLHGHSLKCIIDIYADCVNKEGMIVDFGVLKDIVDRFDHTYLNEELAGEGLIAKDPTAERLSRYIAITIKAHFTQDNANFSKIVVKVYETVTQFAEYTLGGN